LQSLAGVTADYVCTPVDLRNEEMPTDGLLEIVAHPTQLGADFGDAYLQADESLTLVLERRLHGVPRVSYGAANSHLMTGEAALE
jgi:hypothetical protein